MKQFTSLADVADPKALVDKVLQLKASGNSNRNIGSDLTLALLFFNPSLRTRLSSQKAAQLLGMESLVLDVNQGWPLEFEVGAVMNDNKSEHVREAAAVVSQYCDILGIRCFPGLKDRDEDYAEPLLSAFQEYGNKPIINLESATRHPLQGLTDVVTIREHRKSVKPKIVLTWAPHPKALPQSVANSFASWVLAMDYELVITHPEGYELDPNVTRGAHIEYDPNKAYKDADVVYAKNWSSYRDYGKIMSNDGRFMVNAEKMALSNNAFFMHCLPVRRNVVVADDVIDSQQSLVIQQANNRTFAAATVMKEIIELSIYE